MTTSAPRSPPRPRRSQAADSMDLPAIAVPRSASASSGLAKPFQLADVARAALARPREFPWDPLSPSTSSAGWPASPVAADGFSSGESSPQFSAFSSPSSSSPSSPVTEPTSCELSPSNSSEGFNIGAPCVPSHLLPARPPPVAPPASPRRTVTRAQSVPHPLADKRWVPSVPSEPVAWNSKAFSLRLLFTTRNPRPGQTMDDSHCNLPPAFFPSQRIAFAPRMMVTSPDGLPFSVVSSMQLGVTGTLETLNPDGSVKTKRLVADFCTDLSSGLETWKKDSLQSSSVAREKAIFCPGTYMLPLSMKIPNSENLPPSFDGPFFRVTYTMSLAVFSSVLGSDGTPLQLKVFSVPFHVLPSTTPSPPPELPVLTHDYKKGGISSIIKALSFSSPSSPTQAESGYHLVFPSLPTSHFSPASHASIPVSLRIVDRPIEPTDIYIRLALLRKTYVRESSRTSLATAIEDEWGLGVGVSPLSLGYPEEVVVEPWCQDEEEIVSRWGWIPYSSRPGANPNEKAEVLIQDIALPLQNLLDGEGEAQSWSHGYSTSLDLEPTKLPSMTHGQCSWFSAAIRSRPPIAKEYQKHVHVSTRFFLAIEIGFASPALRETLVELKAQSPDMEIPRANGFTQPRRPGTSRYSGASTTNPFLSANSHAKPSSPTASPFNHPPPFPGKMRELMIPVTIGSVAEPGLSCLNSEHEVAAQRAMRQAREDRGEDVRALGEGAGGAWICAPPVYDEALKSAPAYDF